MGVKSRPVKTIFVNIYEYKLIFQDFSFTPELQQGLDAMGFNNPTPIQELAIPLIQSGHDLIACAQTGTGKTAAYVLPVLDRIARSDHSHLNTLIIAPTRELAQQIDQQIEGFSYFINASSIPIYGGGDGIIWEQQKRALHAGADIIIATPGRLISLLGNGDINFSHLQHLILDEADRMLDMGFYDDIVRIIRMLPENRQTLLFSATMPPRIKVLAEKILRNPKEVSIAVSKPAEKIKQLFYKVDDGKKVEFTCEILKDPLYSSVIIFCSSKDSVKTLNKALNKSGIKNSAFHSDLEQKEREEIMRNFKSKNIQVIVGTDVLSRGIDVTGISLVINYDVPPDPEDYIHRIGRTARADESGTAITMINSKDMFRFRRIEKLLGYQPEIIYLHGTEQESADKKSHDGRKPQRGKPMKAKSDRNPSPSNEQVKHTPKQSTPPSVPVNAPPITTKEANSNRPKRIIPPNQ
jgi:ATP-dependent RNA helicase RhlE